MCTLSWTAVGTGYELLFNRDERRTRAPEIAPRAERLESVTFLAPRDSEAGGTWIVLNDAGLTTCLLNGYFASRGDSSVPRESRGQLVLALADARDLGDVHEHLSARDLTPFEPFVLCSFEPSAAHGWRGSCAEWDGLELGWRTLGRDDAPICSSGYDADLARRERRAEWQRLAQGAVMTPDQLGTFHRSHLDGKGPASPCMHREDAETRSLIRIAVDDAHVRMSYAPGPPCCTELGAPLELARRSSPAPLP